MPEIKYKTNYSATKIEKVEVERSTAKSVWVAGSWLGKKTPAHRRSRVSDFDCFFDTWDEAKDYLVKKHERKVAHLKSQTAQANSILGQVKAMKKPDDI